MFLADLMKRWVAIGCEGIWLYYGFILLAKLQWSIASSPHLFIWLLASIIGFGMSTVFRGKDVSSRYVYTIYVTVAAFVLFLQNCYIAEPSWKYRIAAGLVLLFLYFRAIYFAVQNPKRHHMLLRLEGNMLFYLFYVLVQLGNPFTTGTIHIVFAVSLIISLVGMVLTLGDSTDGEVCESQKVGDARWILYPSLAFIAGGLLISILLLLPSMQTLISGVLQGLGGSVISLGERFLSAVKWLLNLIPPPESKGKLDLPAPPTAHPPQETVPELGGEFTETLALGLLALLVLAVLYYLTRLMGKRHLQKSEERPIVSSPTTSFFSHLKRWFQTLLQWTANVMRRMGPKAYAVGIYSNYFQFLQWGKRNGLSRGKNETPKEFAIRVSERLKGNDQLQREVCEFSDLFAAVYYSGENVDTDKEFDTFIQQLKKHAIQKTSSRS